MKLPRAHLLTSKRQLDAVTSPLRLEMLEHLQQAGPSSVADLAALMGRRATALHYHLKLLHGAGLVRVAGRRHAGKRDEALYRLAATAIAMPGRRKQALQTVNATLRLAAREAGRALRDPGMRGAGPGRTLAMRRMRAPLSPPELREVNRLLDTLERAFTRAVKRHMGKRQPPPGEVVSLTFVLTPASRGKP
jgi:DNA-binding transcriptional ArsR family regulator